MEFTNLRISNFRSYKQTDWIPIDHKLIIVGENNAGKSNFLDAINYFFDFNSRKPHGKPDFHLNNVKNPIVIDASFEDFTADEELMFEEFIFDGVLQVRMELTYDTQLESPNTKTYKVQRRVPTEDDLIGIGDKSPEEAIETYYEHEDKLEPYKTEERWKQESRASVERVVSAYLESGEATTQREWVSTSGLSGELGDQLPSLTFYRADRGLDDATRTSNKNSLLYQLLDSALDEVSDSELKRISDELEDIQRDLNSADTFAPIRDLEESLSTKLNSQINHLGPITIENDVPDLEEIVRRRAQVSVQGEYESRLEDVGSGSKMSFLLACLWETCERDTEGMMLGLEEPENDLHPHSQRQLDTTLDTLSEQGNYVFLTTHSPELVSPRDIENIRRVQKNGNQSKIHYLEDEVLTDHEREKLHTLSTTEKNEMFFSRCLLVVEGPTERTAIPLINSILSQNEEKVESFDACGVSIVDAGGRDNIEIYLKIANEFQIPATTLMDDDRDGSEEGELTEQIEIIDSLSDEFVLLEEDIEYSLFKSITLEEYCTAMENLDRMGILDNFHDCDEDLTQSVNSDPNGNKADAIYESFGRHSISKPVLGRQLVDVISENRVPPELERSIRTALNIAQAN